MSKTADSDLYLLTECTKMIESLNSTQGTNAKIAIMKGYVHLQPLLRRVFDPNLKTRITSKGLADFEKKGKDLGKGEQGLCMFELFDKLSSGGLTGDRAKASVLILAAKYSEHSDLVKEIMEKDLRIRMGAKTIMQAFPGMFQEFPVMLAEEHQKDVFDKLLAEHKNIDPPVYISQKIDGVRLMTKVEGGKVSFYSRKGKEFTSLSALLPDFKDMKGNWMIDGELIALDSTGKENFKLTVSAARKKELQMDNPRYKLFDILPLDVWQAGKAGGGLFSERYAKLQSTFKDCKHVEVLEHYPWSPAKMTELEEKAKQSGWEGLMLRFNHAWEPKRSKYLQKFKFFSVEEFVVKEAGVEDMPFPNANGGEDIVKAVKHVLIEFKDCPVWVGSGFTTEERIKYAKDPSLIVGKTIMVQYQEQFQDAKTKKWSLRCPVLRAIVGAQRDF